MVCCPEGSYGFLENSEYTCKGTVEKVDDLEIYVVGSGEKCVFWNYDIFGFTAGRTRQICDLLASKGYMVVLPDYYRGGSITPTDPGLMDWIKKYGPFDTVLLPDVERTLTLAKDRGAKVFGSVGTCWGSYAVINLSCRPEFKAGVSCHPSHSKMFPAIDNKEEETLRRVTCKQLFLSAGNDHENCLPGGLAEKVLRDKVTIEVFPEMAHGWVTRADMSDAKVERDVNKAITMMLQFFNDNLC